MEQKPLEEAIDDLFEASDIAVHALLARFITKEKGPVETDPNSGVIHTPK